MKSMNIDEMREYMSRPEGNCWVGVNMADGNMAMVSRYGTTEEFICEYDGKSCGDEMETTDIEKALRWLWNRRANKGGMSFLVFRRRVDGMIKKAGGGISVSYRADRENGRHIAQCSDGTKIIGNTSSLRVSVRWGAGHAATAEL